MKLSLAPLFVLAACGFDPPGATGDDVQPQVPTVGFAASASEADETSGTIQVAVVLAPSSDQPVSVAYSLVGGTATAEDFTFAAGTLAFAAGETQQAIALAITPDVLEEMPETIELALSSATGEALLGTASHTITIAASTLPRVQFANANTDVTEGTTGTLELVLDKAAPVDVSIQVMVSGGTAAGSDYTFEDNLTVTFPAGSLSQTVSLQALQDQLDEDNELVGLQLVNPSTGLLPGVTFVQDVTLVDDDAAPVASFLVAASRFGEGGQYGAIVRLSAASGRTVTLPFQVIPGAANAATPTTDYALGASPLVFAPGETEKMITISAVADDLIEADETVDLELVAPADGTATLGAIARRTHTIEDDDAVSIRFVQMNGTATEGDSDATYDITVVLSRPVAVAIAVDLVVDPNGTTAESNDYRISPTTLVFPPGSTSQQFDFTVEGDNSKEQDEVVFILLANPTNGATLGNPSRRSIGIRDDD